MKEDNSVMLFVISLLFFCLLIAGVIVINLIINNKYILTDCPIGEWKEICNNYIEYCTAGNYYYMNPDAENPVSFITNCTKWERKCTEYVMSCRNFTQICGIYIEPTLKTRAYDG